MRYCQCWCENWAPWSMCDIATNVAAQISFSWTGELGTNLHFGHYEARHNSNWKWKHVDCHITALSPLHHCFLFAQKKTNGMRLVEKWREYYGHSNCILWKCFLLSMCMSCAATMAIQNQHNSHCGTVQNTLHICIMKSLKQNEILT